MLVVRWTASILSRVFEAGGLGAAAGVGEAASPCMQATTLGAGGSEIEVRRNGVGPGCNANCEGPGWTGVWMMGTVGATAGLLGVKAAPPMLSMMLRAKAASEVARNSRTACPSCCVMRLMGAAREGGTEGETLSLCRYPRVGGGAHHWPRKPACSTSCPSESGPLLACA